MEGKLHKGGSMRLPGKDYSEWGYYFITICTKDRQRFFGDIINHNNRPVGSCPGMIPSIGQTGTIQEMKLSEIGQIAHDFFSKISEHTSFVKVDEFIIMPDHMHGIIYLNGTETVGELSQFGKVNAISISAIVNQYKGSVKRWCNKNNHAYFQWQSKFHDRVVRNEEELNRIRQYIKDNPKNWHDFPGD